MTNADQIRKMTDEELAYFLVEHGDCGVCANGDECGDHVVCRTGVLKWLRKEVSEGVTD